MHGRAVSCFLFAALLPAAYVAAQVPVRERTPAVAPITSLNVTGNKALSAEDILAASGLALHQNGGIATFDDARDRLLATGYFDYVSYTFKQAGEGFAITFAVVEMKQAYPVRPEALPVTVDQVTQILREKIPLFHGLLPGTKQMTERAAAAVEEFLAPANPGLRVRARVLALGPDRFEIQLTPAEGLPVIADLTFEGSKLISAADLHVAAVQGAIGQFYSDSGIHAVLDRVIRPLYEKQGYMAVSFTHITSKPDADVKGVDVHVSVVDGPRFRLRDVSVRGPAAGDSGRILRMANLPAMDVINFDEFTQAGQRIREALRNEGHLDASVSTGREVDEAAQMVDAWFDVNPGPVYTFGKLDIIGLGLDGEAAIRKMWGVRTGDPYPGGYQDRFVKGVKDEQLFDNLGEITVTPNVNRQTHIVDVMLYFAAAPASAPRPGKQY